MAIKLAVERKHIIWALVVFALLAVALIYVERSFSLAEMRDYISSFSFGPWTSLALLVIITIVSAVGFVLAVPVAIAALLLDPWPAFFISFIGLTLGAIIAFAISRHYARDYVERRWINRLKWLEEYDERLEKHGFFTLLFLRLTPIPFEILNIGSGLSRMPYVSFIWATFLGIIPRTLLTIYFVRSTENIWSVQFFIASLLMTLFAVLPLLSKKIRKLVLNT